MGIWKREISKCQISEYIFLFYRRELSNSRLFKISWLCYKTKIVLPKSVVRECARNLVTKMSHYETGKIELKVNVSLILCNSHHKKI
jgi:hypothetical protein